MKAITTLSPTMNDLTHDGENVSELTDEFDEFEDLKNQNRRKMNERFLSQPALTPDPNRKSGPRGISPTNLMKLIETRSMFFNNRNEHVMSSIYNTVGK